MGLLCPCSVLKAIKVMKCGKIEVGVRLDTVHLEGAGNM